MRDEDGIPLGIVRLRGNMGVQMFCYCPAGSRSHFRKHMHCCQGKCVKTDFWPLLGLIGKSIHNVLIEECWATLSLFRLMGLLYFFHGCETETDTKRGGPRGTEILIFRRVQDEE